MTCPDANTLAELADGGLDDTARLEVERHLDDCGTCSELLAELAWIVAPPPPAPPGFELGAPLGDRSWQVKGGERVAAVTYGVRCDPRWVSVRHPNVAVVLDVGERDGEPYVVHELLATTERAWRDAVLRSPGAIRATWLAARLNGGAPSPLADQFGACVALWEVFANRLPFTGATVGALLVSTSTAPEAPDGDRRYRALARGLAAAPASRFASILELAAALDHPRRRGPLVIALALAAVVVAIAVVALAI